MVSNDFPCKTCTHRADRHYVNVASGGGVCTGCGSSRLVDGDDQFHLFVGDNLKYLELQNRREEIKNEQA